MPTPFTPIIRISDGFVSRCSELSISSSSAMICFSISRTIAGSVTRSFLTRFFSSSHIFSAVATPVSANISASSNSSNSSSSILVNEPIMLVTAFENESDVFFSPCFILLKSPIYIISVRLSVDFGFQGLLNLRYINRQQL